MIIKKTLGIIFFIFFSQFLFSQIPITTNEEIDGYYVPGIVVDGDTLLHIYLRQVIIMPKRKFGSKREYRRYSRLVRYVKKVYPYSQIIKQKLWEISMEIDSLPKHRDKKKFIKKKEKELRVEFEGQLRKLTFTQGRILIKLIDRETGETTYELVKQLKGSLSAFFWQSVAVMFGSNLKSEYDAEGDDILIEEIVIRIENGQL